MRYPDPAAMLEPGSLPLWDRGKAGSNAKAIREIIEVGESVRRDRSIDATGRGDQILRQSICHTRVVAMMTEMLPEQVDKTLPLHFLAVLAGSQERWIRDRPLDSRPFCEDVRGLEMGGCRNCRA